MSYDEIKGAVGLDKIDVLVQNKVKKHSPMLQLDFSSFIKGHAVDQLVALISQYKVHGIYVDIGGEIRTIGHKGSKEPWGIGIQSPTQEGLAEVVMANDIAIATSGNYLNYVIKKGGKIGHILDPRTLTPISHQLLSISVIAPTCVIADALATGLFVMGMVESDQWLKKHSEFPALMIFKDGDLIKSKYMNGFRHYIKEIN